MVNIVVVIVVFVGIVVQNALCGIDPRGVADLAGVVGVIVVLARGRDGRGLGGAAADAGAAALPLGAAKGCQRFRPLSEGVGGGDCGDGLGLNGAAFAGAGALARLGAVRCLGLGPLPIDVGVIGAAAGAEHQARAKGKEHKAKKGDRFSHRQVNLSFFL